VKAGFKVWDTDTHIRPSLESLEPHYDAALRARLGAAGRAIVERDYDWDKIGTRLVALYEQARRKL